MITALGPRLGLGLRLDFGSQVWFVQYFSEKKVIVLYAPHKACVLVSISRGANFGGRPPRLPLVPGDDGPQIRRH